MVLYKVRPYSGHVEVLTCYPLTCVFFRFPFFSFPVFISNRGYPKLLLNNREIFLANTAKWAYPILGDVLKSCSCSDSAFGVAYFRVINPTTCVTNVLFHFFIPFFLLVNNVFTLFIILSGLIIFIQAKSPRMQGLLPNMLHGRHGKSTCTALSMLWFHPMNPA